MKFMSFLLSRDFTIRTKYNTIFHRYMTKLYMAIPRKCQACKRRLPYLIMKEPKTVKLWGLHVIYCNKCLLKTFY